MSNGEFDPQKIEEFLERLRSNRNSWKFGAMIVAALLLIYLAATTIYSIQPDEVGVVQRFGKHIDTTYPGLHFKFPSGIDKLTRIKTQFIYKQEFGYVAGARAARGRQDEISLMLTGDLNIADVRWNVQYRIQEPEKFLFKVNDPVRTLIDASEAAMRTIIGDRSVDEVLTAGRGEIDDQVRDRLQLILDGYQTGIHVMSVLLQDVNPPDPVKESFDDVNKAKQEKETVINRAREAYNKVIPRARGQADQTIANAQGYATRRINEARGDADRFLQVYQAYAASPTVVRRRLYIEAMTSLFGRVGNVWIVDEKLKNVVPLMQFMGQDVKPEAPK